MFYIYILLGFFFNCFLICDAIHTHNKSIYIPFPGFKIKYLITYKPVLPVKNPPINRIEPINNITVQCRHKGLRSKRLILVS